MKVAREKYMKFQNPKIIFSFFCKIFISLSIISCTFVFSMYVSADDVQYVYDSLNRLVEVRYPDKVIRYTYDAAGNRTGQTVEILIAAPSILNLSPRGAVVGGNGFVLKINGANFTNSSVVQWNGANRPTTYVNTGELRINLASSDFAAVGTASVVVVNSTPSLSVSNSQTFSVVQTAALRGRVTSGGAALSNVSLNLSGTESDIFITDINGNFEAAVLNIGSYTLTPSRQNYVFNPPTRNISYAGTTQTNLDFAASLVNYTINGRVTNNGIGSSGVTLNLTGSQTGQTTTDTNGNYSFTATAEGNYVVTPSLSGYTFNPNSQSFNNLSANQTADFTATATPTPTPTPTGTVSGKVIYANALTTISVPFTTLDAVGSIPLSITTDANGFYSMTGFGSGAYTITPSKTNQINGISNLDASRIAQHIVGLNTLTANQQIAADTSGNGTISALDAAYIAQFAALITNPGITGTWKFLPTSRSYPNVMTNQANQDYSATLVGDVTGNWNPLGLLRPELLGLGDLTTEEEKIEQHVAITARRNQAAEEKTAFTVNLTAPELMGADVLGYQFDLLYDEAVILPQTTPCDTSGTISNGLSAVCNAVKPGLLKVIVFGTTPMSGEGTLLKLNFNAVGTAGDISPLTFQNFFFNEDTPSAKTVNGSVLIVSPTLTSTPTPSGNVCTSITTFTEEDLFPGSLASFGVSSGAGRLRLTTLTAEQGCNHSRWSIPPMW